ncbi:MAG: pitrilysin family protein [Gemmatimonadota bacterium]|nr:pitrilysin family protein [Gemmatimonadota bacterium]
MEINRCLTAAASAWCKLRPDAARVGMAALLALGCLAAGPLAPGRGGLAHAQRAQLEKVVQRRILPNGLEVIVIENHGVPLVTLEVTVRNGAFTQSPEFAGLAHLYEHMFFKANDTYPDADQYIDRMSTIGAVFNASTREEQVNYYLTVSSDSLEAGLKLLVSGFLAPRFRADELDRERQVVIGEYDRNESSPFFRMEQESGRRLWGAQWSRKNTIGERDVILSTTPEKMRAIQKLYYVPNNSVLIIAGDVNPTAAFAQAERIFGTWARGEDPFAKAPIPPIPPLAAPQAVIIEEAVNAVTVLIQWHGPSVRADESATFVADVYSDVLNNPQSRFQKRLVDSGLWQAVGVNYYTLNNVGPISVSGQTSPERLREAIRAVLAELAATVQPGYFTADELAATKASRAVTTEFGMERSSEFAHTIGFWWSVSGLEYYMKYIDEMAKRSVADLQRYARTYIVNRPYVVSVLLSPEDRRRINLTERELLILGGTAR